MPTAGYRLRLGFPLFSCRRRSANETLLAIARIKSVVYRRRHRPQAPTVFYTTIPPVLY
ncbi:hypothetical protein H6G36_26755 [Anabaena minutissima FACHB-250]|nr:hypothetical protein [Anabaena minutissima FACHB-250]